MLLVIDSGNTSINFAIYENYKLIVRFSIGQTKMMSADFLYVMIINLLDRENININLIKHALLSSVTPAIDAELIKFVNSNIKIDLEQIGHGKYKKIIKTEILEEAKIGQDRLVNAWYGYFLAQKSCIIVDLGTATNFDFVNDQGVYIGGIIAPGLDLSIESLYTKTAQLPRIKYMPFPELIGNNTIAAIQSGIFWGYRSLISGILDKSYIKFNNKPTVFATGGYAKSLDSQGDLFNSININFTLDGLAQLHKQKNINS